MVYIMHTETTPISVQILNSDIPELNSDFIHLDQLCKLYANLIEYHCKQQCSFSPHLQPSGMDNLEGWQKRGGGGRKH